MTKKIVQMKMYVWEGVLTDYTDGLIVVHAESVDHARELWRREYFGDKYEDAKTDIERYRAIYPNGWYNGRYSRWFEIDSDPLVFAGEGMAWVAGGG